MTIIGASDEALTDEARNTLHALAVFPPKPNSFSEEAALFVSAATTDALDELSDHGLLEAVGREHYVLHQSIVDYARLNAVAKQTQERFVRYYIQYAQQHTDDHNALNAELDNISAALTMAQQIGSDDLLWALLDAMFSFLELKGYYDLAEKYLEQLLEGEHLNRDQARMWLHFGRIAYKRDDFYIALERWENGLKLASTANVHETAVALLSGLSMIKSDQAQYEEAAQYSEQVVEHALASNNWYELCRSHALRGRLALIMDRYDEADNQLEIACQIARENSLPSLACVSLNMRGIIAKNRGELLLATQLYYEGLLIAREHRLDARALEQLVNLGELHNELREYDEATAYLEEGVALARRFQDPSKEAHLLLDLAIACIGIGDIKRADTLLPEALSLAKEIDDNRLVAHIHANWGAVCFDEHRVQAAEVHFNTCLELVPEVSRNKRIAGLAYFGLAKIELARGNRGMAENQACEGLFATEDTGQSIYVEIQNWLRENGFDADDS
jgi:tetratricopeptide (TPR) repeat protein